MRTGWAVGATRAAWAAFLLGALACGGPLDERLDRLDEQVRQGDAAAAIGPLRTIVEEHPERARARLLLGEAYLRTGQPSLAVWPLEAAAEDPKLAVRANTLLATAFLATENAEGAVRAATRVHEAEPGDTAILHTRARALLAAGRPEEALADAERLRVAEPDGYDALLLRAGALADLGRLDEAEQAHRELRAAAADDGAEYAIRGCLALAHFLEESRRDAVRAARVVEECVAEQPTDAFTLKLATEFFDRQRRPGHARRMLERALELAPDDLGIRAALAGRWVAEGFPERAERVLLEAHASGESFESWRLLSELYRRTGRPVDAGRALERAESFLGEDDDRETLRFQRADLAIDAGDLDAAEALAADLEKPEYRELVRGRILLERGDAAGALAALEAGTRLWPNNAYARYLAGRAALESGDPARAAGHLREATRADATASDAALVLAQLYLEDGRHRDALEMARRHRTSRPDRHADALRLAARAHTGLGQPKAAMKSLQEAADAGADRRTLTLDRATVARSVAGPAAAAAVLESGGFDLASEDALLRVLVEDLLAAGRRDEAAARIDAAIARQGETPALLALRGRARLGADAKAEARRDFEAALAAEPEQPMALLGLAELARLDGDVERALALYDRAGAAAGEDAGSAYRAAQMALAAGRTDEAERRLRAILARKPGFAYAANDLAWLLAEEGRDLELALELAERAVRLAPSPDVFDTLGWVQLKSGRPEAALVSFRRALGLGASNPTILYHLALAQVARGDEGAAAESLGRALAAGPFPEEASARAELERIRGG